MKIGIALIGEAFRLGGQGNRNRDSEASYEQQKTACDSHLKLADSLSKKGFVVDFFIESYCTKYEKDLNGWYGDRLKNCSLRKDLVGLSVLGRDALLKIEGYDCVFVCRIDLRLKDMFIKIFNPEWQNVMFPSACWILDCHYGKFPRVSDTMLFIPSRFKNKVNKKFILSHKSWMEYVNSRTLSNEDMGLMLGTYHDSDSAKDYNPLYTIVNRNESKFWHSMGCHVGEDFMPVQNWGRRTFPDWTPKDMIRSNDFHGNMWEWWHKDQSVGVFRFINLIRFEESGRVGHYNHRDQRYWRMESESMIIMNEGKKVSSVLERISDSIYSGKFEFDNGIMFMIRKAKKENWASCWML